MLERMRMLVEIRSLQVQLAQRVPQWILCRFMVAPFVTKQKSYKFLLNSKQNGGVRDI